MIAIVMIFCGTCRAKLVDGDCPEGCPYGAVEHYCVHCGERLNDADECDDCESEWTGISNGE